MLEGAGARQGISGVVAMRNRLGVGLAPCAMAACNLSAWQLLEIMMSKLHHGKYVRQISVNWSDLHTHTVSLQRSDWL